MRHQQLQRNYRRHYTFKVFSQKEEKSLNYKCIKRFYLELSPPIIITSTTFNDMRTFTHNSAVVNNDETKKSISGNLQQRYLHISPDGDYWVGTSIFAAKHLQPDYVKSILIPEEFDPEDYFENMVKPDEALRILYQAYDDGFLPKDIFKP